LFCLLTLISLIEKENDIILMYIIHSVAHSFDAIPKPHISFYFVFYFTFTFTLTLTLTLLC